MNPLTIKARLNVSQQRRENLLISIGCGVVLAVLCVAFFL
jgi:hypothetical protein